MSAKRIATVVPGVAAVALLGGSRSAFFQHATCPQVRSPSLLDSDAGGQSTGPGTAFAHERPLSWFETQIGRNYDDCKSKRLHTAVCKQRFESRDQKWASETEQRIYELVSMGREVPAHVFAATGRGWDKDRAERLRLGLVTSGLIEDDAEVDVNANVPASGDVFPEMVGSECFA